MTATFFFHHFSMFRWLNTSYFVFISDEFGWAQWWQESHVKTTLPWPEVSQISWDRGRCCPVAKSPGKVRVLWLVLCVPCHPQLIYDDLWWFMMIYDDLWWFMMIYDDLWWFMMIYDDFIHKFLWMRSLIYAKWRLNGQNLWFPPYFHHFFMARNCSMNTS